jgi:hypothetical protein
MNVTITEKQLKNLTQGLSEDLDYHKVSDASPEKDNYIMSQKNEEDDVDEGSRTLARTRKKRLFSKAEIMANPNRYKLHDKKLKGLNESAVLKYTNPLSAEISKSLDKRGKNGKPRQNIFKIITNNTTRYYSIVGDTLITGRNNLNFKSIVKKSNGDMIFYRYVKGGTEPHKIEFSKMKDLLMRMSKGQSKINPGFGLYFYKLKY